MATATAAAPSQVSSCAVGAGGREYATTVDTLTQREPGSLLAAMFAGGAAHRLPTTEDGAVFVDRDREQFRHVLNWLRDVAVPALVKADCRRLLRKAEYYRMHGLIDYMNERIGEEKKVDGSPEAELTRKDVVRCIQAEKVRFRGVNLSRVNLSKLDLSEVDFSCGCLKKTDFSHANLQKAKFGEVEASRSSFQYANLRECEFVGANLDESILDRANLQSANLQDACLTKCSFIETDLRSAHLQSANLTGANLAQANLEGANLKGAKLTGSNLQGANLQRAYLQEVDLRETGKSVDFCSVLSRQWRWRVLLCEGGGLRRCSFLPPPPFLVRSRQHRLRPGSTCSGGAMGADWPSWSGPDLRGAGVLRGSARRRGHCEAGSPCGQESRGGYWAMTEALASMAALSRRWRRRLLTRGQVSQVRR